MDALTLYERLEELIFEQISDVKIKVQKTQISFSNMQFSRIYPMLVAKAEKKGRTREEVDAVTCWLIGSTDLAHFLETHDLIMSVDVRILCRVSAATANRILVGLTAEGKLEKARGAAIGPIGKQINSNFPPLSIEKTPCSSPCKSQSTIVVNARTAFCCSGVYAPNREGVGRSDIFHRSAKGAYPNFQAYCKIVLYYEAKSAYKDIYR